MMAMGEMWASLGSAMASIMFVWTMYQNYFPYELRGQIRRFGEKLRSFVYPYIQIIFPEYQGDGFERSRAFTAIERYLDKNSTKQAKRLRANVIQDCEQIVLSMQEAEEVTDEYERIKLWWSSSKHTPPTQSFSFYPREEAKRYFTLTFHKKHREIITKMYLKHVLDQGKAITVSQRQRKLYTNNKSEGWYGYKRTMWSSVVFEHPSTFDTLAMEPKKKQEIMDDLITFSKSKDYYAKIGKAWKRGYLLYGPPGTGKSSMIAAMATFMKYDVYDLELTSVKDNTELRKLLIDTSGKAIIVIEDIDCSLDLTGQREKKKEKNEDEKDENDPVKKKMKNMEEKKSSQVTLSGLLNFIDGLWSALGGERLIVFTTNFVEKLDPALIRRGRMDKHIELSYCGFEAFKVLAKNYLDIESHNLFSEIEHMLEETNVTPADVAENLMPKAAGEGADICLERLIKAIKQAKEDARLKAEEEAKLKAEEEERLRAEKEEKEKQKEGDSEVKSSEETLTKGVKENGEEVKEKGKVAS
ncbi:AAA-ATPase ASD, mitochondrial-like [Coffea eugenioides]|uniref:AAA-ATPase ASD, mitochondrial n=1 Tax=Coffea arabica TaxID=13443 RepID=A0A6P6TFF4_COFAR|nr:AAA-ATPase ASD, mitochondrial-like [Coffea arabica]XP_027178283.1 AAA-ATPase ASD, mitochondrial-like [Coffea eugenioides]